MTAIEQQDQQLAVASMLCLACKGSGIDESQKDCLRFGPLPACRSCKATGARWPGLRVICPARNFFTGLPVHHGHEAPDCPGWHVESDPLRFFALLHKALRADEWAVRYSRHSVFLSSLIGRGPAVHSAEGEGPDDMARLMDAALKLGTQTGVTHDH